MHCPLCHHTQLLPFHQDRRAYYRCQHCWLVFVEPACLPDKMTEKGIYDLHQNHQNDPGYRRFLGRLQEPLVRLLPAGAGGLDFGCGPAPLLVTLLKRAGFPCQGYDPFYAPDVSLLQQQYDFICCSEAIEHFHQPAREWRLWLQMLRPGGYLAIMTKRVWSQQAFARWHYKNDPTHVSFFSDETFDFLARRDGLTWRYKSADVVIFQVLATNRFVRFCST